MTAQIPIRNVNCFATPWRRSPIAAARRSAMLRWASPIFAAAHRVVRQGKSWPISAICWIGRFPSLRANRVGRLQTRIALGKATPNASLLH